METINQQTHTKEAKSEMTAVKKLAKDIFVEFKKMSAYRDVEVMNLKSIPLYQQICRSIKRNEKLQFILPAFPAKSNNSEKTINELPDFGEYLALKILNDVCASINKHYQPGAEVIICSDGRVFNDIVFVSDENLQKYKDEIKAIIKRENLSNLKTFSLDDCFEHQDYATMREHLVSNFAPSLDYIRAQVKSDDSVKRMFNGIHRFMKEDLSFLNGDLSRNQIMKKSKALAYEVIQRSRAWDQLLQKHFPATLRLSIHPYPLTHAKFGVQLIPSSDVWATPWHNVVVKYGDSYTLVKRKAAQEMGAKMKLLGGKYAYYQAG